MQNINKKALSNTVSVSLILLFAIIGVSSVALVINQTVNEPALAPQRTCFDINFKEALSLQKACYNEKTKEIELTIKRAFDNINIESLRFIISGRKSETFTCSRACSNCDILPPGETRIYYFDAKSFIEPTELVFTAESCPIAETEIKLRC